MSGTVSLSRTAFSSYPVGQTMSQSKLNAEFERVILPHLNSAYNLARWLLRNEQDAQDVVHDSFLRAHRYFESFDGSDARAWLLGIVRNACFSALRSSKVQQIATDDDLDRQSTSSSILCETWAAPQCAERDKSPISAAAQPPILPSSTPAPRPGQRNSRARRVPEANSFPGSLPTSTPPP